MYSLWFSEAGLLLINKLLFSFCRLNDFPHERPDGLHIGSFLLLFNHFIQPSDLLLVVCSIVLVLLLQFLDLCFVDFLHLNQVYLIFLRFFNLGLEALDLGEQSLDGLHRLTLQSLPLTRTTNCLITALRVSFGEVTQLEWLLHNV